MTKYETEPTAIQEVVFDDLEVGDTLVLDTSSGSQYRLYLTETEPKPIATLERSSSHDVEDRRGAHWQNVTPETIFELQGSCPPAYVAMYGSPIAADTTEGRFEVGQRAWMRSRLENEPSTLVTSTLAALAIIKAES